MAYTFKILLEVRINNSLIQGFSKLKLKKPTLTCLTVGWLRAGFYKTKLTLVYLVKIIFLTDVKLVPSTPVASIL